MKVLLGKYVELLDKLINAEQISFEGITPSSLPYTAGVYRIFEDQSADQSVYIGQTGNFRERLYSNHLMGNPQASVLKRKLIARKVFTNAESVKQYFFDMCSIQILEIDDEQERKYFEHFAIAILRPEYND